MSIPPELAIGIFSGIVGVAVALIGWFGRKDEVKAQSYKNLFEGQDKRIDRLENRLEKVEIELRDTKVELSAEQATVWTLRRHLDEAIDFFDELASIRMDVRGILPPVPDVDRWRYDMLPGRGRGVPDE